MRKSHLDQLNKTELHALAEYYGVDHDVTDKNAQLVSRLIGESVTIEMFHRAFSDAGEDEDTLKEEVVEVVSDTVKEEGQGSYLIKMVRDNPYFEWRKYKFTTDHPYVTMPTEDAQEILTSEEGFRQAFPKELASFY